MSARTLSILGVTGSIGTSTVRVVEAMAEAQGEPAFQVVAVTGNANIEGLAAAARRLRARIAVTADPARLEELRAALDGSGTLAAAGPDALVAAASEPADVVMAAIVGAAGLAPTMAALGNGGTVALANKECLVAAGELFLAEVARQGARLLPVDSEHNAIFQLRAGHGDAEIERLILTASGGPFRESSAEEMQAATPTDASAHPNWSMGPRITIDSATLFNKALEMIEAHHLFAVPPERIEVVVHPQSVIHSMIGFRDGSILAHMGPADMAVAIGYALAFPDRATLPVERLDFARLARLDFEPPDPARFPALRLAREAMATGGAGACVLNAAKEVALTAFIDGRIGFLRIAGVTEDTMERLHGLPAPAAIEDVYEVDASARRVAAELVATAAD